MAEVLLDTHVLVWWLGERGKLSTDAIDAIDEARVIKISAISCWEIGMLVAKGRISLDRSTAAWVTDVLALPRVEAVPLDVETAVVAAELENFHGDPADRFLVATAMVDSIPLVSKDRSIQTWTDAGSLTCIW